MTEIINILGEVRIPITDYDKMCDRVRQLENDNKRLTEMLDRVCDENSGVMRRGRMLPTKLNDRTNAIIG